MIIIQLNSFSDLLTDILSEYLKKLPMELEMRKKLMFCTDEKNEINFY